MGSGAENPEDGDQPLWKRHEEDPTPDPPPIFKSWARAYAFVIGFLILLIVLFYLFTISYSGS